jgi:Family of unknown function (DUF5985)
MNSVQAAIYFLCFVTSATVMLLLLRSYRRNRARLLLWSALAFVALAINNFLLFIDIVLLPNISLLPLRHASALAAAALLIYGFTFETD